MVGSQKGGTAVIAPPRPGNKLRALVFPLDEFIDSRRRILERYRTIRPEYVHARRQVRRSRLTARSPLAPSSHLPSASPLMNAASTVVAAGTVAPNTVASIRNHTTW